MEPSARELTLTRRGSFRTVSQHSQEVAMRQGLRKFSLTTHITLAVGWIGAISAYLVDAREIPRAE